MLKKINYEQFDYFFQILKDSFPAAEYRPYDQQKELLKHPSYQIIVHEEEQINGIFAKWEGPNFIFLEHFAVASYSRNKGLGSKLLQQFIDSQTKPVILEIEKPTNEIQKRRVQFYERNGFQISNFGYPQPVLTPGEETISLIWMTYPQELNSEVSNLAKEWIFKEVYRI